MTIEAGQISDGMSVGEDYYRWKKRLLLRPHGSGGRIRAGRVQNWDGESREWIIDNGGTLLYELTRADAAQAVYKARKKAEKKLRSMMPSAYHEWTEDIEC